MKSTICWFIIVGLSVPLVVSGQTNALWFKSVTFPTTNEFRLSDACEFIERESAKVDKTGQGLKVLFPPDFTNRTAIIRFDPLKEPISFADALNLSSGLSGETKYRVFDRTAVIGYWCYRETLLALAGRCSDAVTGTPITNFTIKSVNEFDPDYLTIDAGGKFACGVHHRFDYMSTPSAVIADHDIWHPEEQVFEFSAPGYQKLVVSNSIYWAHSWGTRFVDAKMKPDSAQTKEANKTSQIIVAPAPKSERCRWNKL